MSQKKQDIQELERLEKKLAELTALSESYEKKSPGRDRVVSLLVKCKSVSDSIDALKEKINKG